MVRSPHVSRVAERYNDLPKVKVQLEVRQTFGLLGGYLRSSEAAMLAEGKPLRYCGIGFGYPLIGN